jgi:protein-S-isoprenylcysteine O-methyltransferase Ste14
MLWLILSVFLWGIVHSILASQGTKAWLRCRFGEGVMRFYRFGYNLFAALSFLPVLWLAAVLPDRDLYRIPSPWLYLTLAGQLLAVVLEGIGLLQTDTLSFIGLRQLIEGEEKPAPLVMRGLYRWVRHPLYTAGLLFLWLTPVMTVNLLTLCAAATIYIIVGAYFEERKLLREYGAAYAEYQASTPMLIPGLWFRRDR